MFYGYDFGAVEIPEGYWAYNNCTHLKVIERGQALAAFGSYGYDPEGKGGLFPTGTGWDCINHQLAEGATILTAGVECTSGDIVEVCVISVPH